MTVQTVLDRGLVRGRSIWPAFQYQVPGLLAVHISDRAVVFGVYSGAYLHGYSYLKEITYEALAQMVLAYDQAMAELTAEEQRAVIDVTAKRYIEDQTLAAKDAALVNKQRKVDQKEAEVDTKIEALETDRQALATKIVELNVAQQKVATLIKELEAKLQEQVLESAQVEAEITRQELIAQKADLDVLETGVRALEIQAQIADAAYRLASINTKKVELESDIDRIDLDTAEVPLKVAALEADISRLNLDVKEVAVRVTELLADKSRIGVDTAEVTVRVMGLNSDIKRLVLEKDEVAFKKIELQAEADRLGYDFSEVGIKVDMLEAEIDNLEFSVEEMPVRKAFLEADRNRLDYEYNEVPVRVSDLEAETARLITQKGYEVLTESEKDVAIAKTTAAQAEVASLKLREPLGDKRIAAADDEISKTIPKLSTAIADERAADLDAQAARNEHTVAEYGTRKTSFDTKVKTSGTVTKLTTDSHTEEAKQIKDNADNTQDYYAAVQAANKARNDNAFAYAEAIQTADIVNTMTHQIGAAK